MPHFQKRGNRIRASDKSLVFRFSASSQLLLFLVVILLLNLKTIAATDWKSVHFLQDGSVHLTVTPYMIVSVIAALLICEAAALLYRIFQYDRIKRLFPRQKLAKMILENGWYKSETIKDSGFFKEVIEQRIVDTNRIENFVKGFAKSYYSWSNTQESIDKRTAAISSIPSKSSYEPKAQESDGTVDAATAEEVTEFLETFFKLYPTATEKELVYYVSGNALSPVNCDYTFSELVNPIFTKDEEQVKVSVSSEVSRPENKGNADFTV